MLKVLIIYSLVNVNDNNSCFLSYLEVLYYRIIVFCEFLLCIKVFFYLIFEEGIFRFRVISRVIMLIYVFLL